MVVVKPIQNLPFGFSVIHNTKVCKILEAKLTLHLIFDGERCNCCRRPLLDAFNIPDIHFSPSVLFIQLTFHFWAPQWYILSKDPLKRHLRCTFDAILGPQDKIYAFLLPPEIYQKYTQKTGYTQRHYLAGERQERRFPTRKKHKTEEFHWFSDWIAIWQPSN